MCSRLSPWLIKPVPPQLSAKADGRWFRQTQLGRRKAAQALTAATIGLPVTLLISLVGPLTMGCFNPTRDVGPRVFSALAGWGSLPFQVNGTGWWTVYLLAPLLSGLLGGAIYAACFKPAYTKRD